MEFGFCAPIEHLTIVGMGGYDFLELPLAAILQPEVLGAKIMPELQELLHGQRLRLDAFNVFLPGDLKIIGPATDSARQERYVTAAFARVSALGGKIVVFGSGRSRPIPDGFSRTEAETQMLVFLRLCGPLAAAQRVTLVIEPLNSGECNYINGVSEALRLAQIVNHPSVCVLSDLYHVNLERQSFEETRSAGPWLKHVHVAGLEERRIPTWDDVDYLASYFRVLKEMDYQGRISVEGNAKDVAQEAPVALEVVRKAWQIA